MDVEKVINSVVARFIGTKHERDVKALQPLVEAINALEPEMQKLTDAQLSAKTPALKAEVQARMEGLERDDPDYKQRLQEALEAALVPAFAVAREAGRRALSMRHFDVQLIGGAVLHEGKISEMKTGEGKTLVATLPAYLNALTGKGVHIVTVNDYLARRDAEWMGPIYKMLGLSVGVIVHDLDDAQRRAAYAADITFGTNNEFGFDYLRDNMKYELAQCVQRGHHFAIVDEVDSILIDEARTPLIISGPAEESTDKYVRIDKVMPKLIQDIDYTLDEKHKTSTLTEEGISKTEKLLGINNLFDPGNMDIFHHVHQALRAHALFQKDVDYVVRDGEVVIVDEFTGRQMPGRRWSDGLHQAVEAKEGVKIERENQTLATITFQNYFRMHKKLAGMTGTAETEAPEFDKIYRLEVMVIPPNKVMRRLENPDVVYRTEKEKYYAASDEIQTLHDTGRPVLVGTTSIEKSERLSELLKKKGIKHVVLNAKYHEREAEIVAQAGRKDMVTIATNMAGRGTDILLGGNPEFMAKQECVKKGIAQPLRAAQGKVQAVVDDTKNTVWYYAGNEYVVPTDQWTEIFNRYKAQTDKEHDEVIAAGGLHIFGTERHEARRIDNQLRGRAGRQGDPGSSRFYLSLEDDLMRIFAKEWVSNLLQRLGMEEGVPIESRMISRRIEGAQKAVEAQNFEARKHLLEYDDVMNKQRTAVYGLRGQLLEGLDQKELILEDYVANLLSAVMEAHAPEAMHPDQWDVNGLKAQLASQFGIDLEKEGIHLDALDRHELGEAIFERLKEKYEMKEAILGGHTMRLHERMVMLSVLDGLWKDHLLNMDHLKEGIGLRGYGQHDPLVEYKRESFDMFEAMMQRSQEETVRYLYLMQILERPSEGGPPRPGAPPQLNAPPPQMGEDGNGRKPRHVATSVDEIEEAFQRKKRRELDQARMAGSGDLQAVQQVVRGAAKVGRNDPCPCGSGKKHKKCCGAGA